MCVGGLPILKKQKKTNKHFFSSKCDISEWLATPRMGTTESKGEMLSLRFRRFFLTLCDSTPPPTHPPTSTPAPSPTRVGSMHDSSLTVLCDWNHSLPPTSIQGCTSTAPRGSISTGGRGGEFPFKVPDELPLTVTSLTGWGMGGSGGGLEIKRNKSSLEACCLNNQIHWLRGSRRGRKQESYYMSTLTWYKLFWMSRTSFGNNCINCWAMTSSSWMIAKCSILCRATKQTNKQGKKKKNYPICLQKLEALHNPTLGYHPPHTHTEKK